MNFYCVGTWSDGCTNSETNPKGTAPVYSLFVNGSGGSIISSSGLYTAGATAPSTDVARCTISGLFDGTTVTVTKAATLGDFAIKHQIPLAATPGRGWRSRRRTALC